MGVPVKMGGLLDPPSIGERCSSPETGSCGELQVKVAASLIIPPLMYSSVSSFASPVDVLIVTNVSKKGTPLPGSE